MCCAQTSPRIPSRTFFPESRLDAKLVDSMNEYAEVMRENLAQSFVRRSDLSLGANATTELRLNHVKRGFDVAAPMIEAQKRTAFRIVRPRSLKDRAACGCRLRSRQSLRQRKDVSAGADHTVRLGPAVLPHLAPVLRVVPT